MPKISKAFISDAEDAPAYWQIGNLWRVMAVSSAKNRSRDSLACARPKILPFADTRQTGVQTDNSFTLLDQIIHSGGGGGPMTHTHTQDEGLYVIKGKCTFNAGGHHGLPGTPGTLVAIPGNTEHSFTVDEPDTQVLNFYLPAGFEQLLIGVAHPAEENAPPPQDRVQEMLPPQKLSAKLAKQYGQDNILGDPFNDPPNPDLMHTKPTPGATIFPFTANAETDNLESFWTKNGLWTILAPSALTGDTYSLIEQRFRKGPVYPPHVFDDKDIIYYIFKGEMSFLFDDRVAKAQEGALIFVPRGTVHAASAETDVHCLNIHTPGGFDEYVKVMGQPAKKLGLPPDGVDVKEVDAGIRARLMGKLGMRNVSASL